MKTSHIYKRNSALLAAALAAGTLGSVSSSHAQAVINNGTVQLGINATGELNFGGSGLRLLGVPGFGSLESTLDGCPCEGWGAAYSSGQTVYFNQSSGGTGEGGAFATYGTFNPNDSARSTVVSAAGGLTVTHDYHPIAGTPFLYQVDVSITNTGATPENLLYRRVMDWDIEPTPFDEFVTMQGYAGGAGFLKHVSDNGFAISDPLDPMSSILFLDTNVVDNGPTDHGALFQFDFGNLNPGDTRSFKTFYGAAYTEAQMLAALGLVGIEAYSLGESDTDGGPTLGTPGTFAFGFDEVGLPPAPVPEPTTIFGGIALAGLAGAKLLRRKKA